MMSDREKLLAELEKSYDIFCPHETQKRFCLPMDLKEALIAALSEPEWRPIAEAPRDGTPIIAWCGNTKYPVFTQFKDNEWRASHYGAREPYWYYGDLKYWVAMPLPSPPKGKTP